MASTASRPTSWAMPSMRTTAQATTTVMSIPPPQPLVTVSKVLLTLNKKHQVTRITVDISGPFGASAADSLAAYHLTTAGKARLFTAKNAKPVKLKSAVCTASTNSIALTPKKPFALSKPVQLRVSGLPPTGLTDNSGRLIDGNHDGRPGGDAVVVLGKKAQPSRRLFQPPPRGLPHKAHSPFC